MSTCEHLLDTLSRADAYGCGVDELEAIEFDPVVLEIQVRATGAAEQVVHTRSCPVLRSLREGRAVTVGSVAAARAAGVSAAALVRCEHCAGEHQSVLDPGQLELYRDLARAVNRCGVIEAARRGVPSESEAWPECLGVDLARALRGLQRTREALLPHVGGKADLRPREPGLLARVIELEGALALELERAQEALWQVWGGSRLSEVSATLLGEGAGALAAELGAERRVLLGVSWSRRSPHELVAAPEQLVELCSQVRLVAREVSESEHSALVWVEPVVALALLGESPILPGSLGRWVAWREVEVLHLGESRSPQEQREIEAWQAGLQFMREAGLGRAASEQRWSLARSARAALAEREKDS